MPNNDLLFVGLDSAEPVLLRNWAAAGKLPNIATLLEEGHVVEIKPPPGLGNDGTWASLFTGVNPTRHGRYYPVQLRSGSYDFFQHDEDLHYRHEPFWLALSRAGKKVAVLDMVKAPLTANINGIQITEWTAHDRLKPARSWPSNLINEIEQRFGTDPFNGFADHWMGRDEHDFVELRDRMVKRIETKTNAALYCFEHDDFDFRTVVYADPHDIGHTAWHLHDPDHPQHDVDWLEQHGDPLLAVYQALDVSIGRLLSTTDDDTAVMLFAGPGMGPHYTGNELMEVLLARMSRNGHTRLPETEFFVLPHNSNSGGIRINLAGREPNGCVQPIDYDQLCAYLEHEFRQLTDPNSGDVIVSDVVKVRDRYSGEFSDDLPDLFVVWHRPRPIRWVASERIGAVLKPIRHQRTGDHTPNCLLLTKGMRISTNEAVIEAIAPTICRHLGVTLEDTNIPSLLVSDGTGMAQI